MIGKFFAKLFILIVFYLFLCGLIYVTSYISLSKNIFINFIGFKAVQKNLYWNKEFGFVDVWQNKEDCITYDKELIYVPKIGSCDFKNAEFKTTLKFTDSGRFMPTINNANKKPIIVTGDSHAMGWGVNDDKTFSYILQNDLKRQVYNLAVSSYGTVREIKRLNSSNLLSDSDILIIQYHENDYLENKNFSTVEKKEYRSKFTKLKELEDVNLIKKLKFVLKTYKSSLRLIFTDITGLFVKTKKEINFDLHYSYLLKELKNINNFEEKKIIIFYSNGPESKFFNFPNGIDKNHKNIRFLDIELNAKDHFYLDQHPNELGHKKIAIALKTILNKNY